LLECLYRKASKCQHIAQKKKKKKKQKKKKKKKNTSNITILVDLAHELYNIQQQ